MLICLHILSAAFMPQRQDWAAATGTRGPSKPKIFATWPLTEKVCQPLIYLKLTSCSRFSSLLSLTQSEQLRSHYPRLSHHFCLPENFRSIFFYLEKNVLTHYIFTLNDDLFFNIYLFIWLPRVLVAACGIFAAARGVFSLQRRDSLALVRGLSSCSTWAELVHSMWDLSSPTRDQTCVPCIAKQIFNHWTTREVSKWLFIKRDDIMNYNTCRNIMETVIQRPQFSPRWTVPAPSCYALCCYSLHC